MDLRSILPVLYVPAVHLWFRLALWMELQRVQPILVLRAVGLLQWWLRWPRWGQSQQWWRVGKRQWLRKWRGGGLGGVWGGGGGSHTPVPPVHPTPPGRPRAALHPP